MEQNRSEFKSLSDRELLELHEPDNFNTFVSSPLDALTKDECARWLEWSARLFIAFLPLHTDNVLLGLRSHAETLVKHTQLLWPFRAYREGKQALLRRVLHMQLWAVISDIESVERLRRLVRDKYRLDAGVDWHSYWTEMLSQGL